MLNINQFRSALHLQVSAAKIQASGRTEEAGKCRKILQDLYDMMSERQKDAFVIIECTESPSQDEIEEAMQRSLEPIQLLSFSNLTKRRNVKRVRRFASRVLNAIGAGHEGHLPWLKKGGSQYRTLRALCGRDLLREKYDENGKQVGWVAGPELKNFELAGGLF